MFRALSWYIWVINLELIVICKSIIKYVCLQCPDLQRNEGLRAKHYYSFNLS